ncbi:class I SAM-dependent methyltransferase [Streptomyces sp. A7024]|uniref:Class I SAM-dependent methyltransferase n=1 Tax=Streptomyces coryli TaxID=1128680 RepID=A0A6G4TZL3_9ACTN|nr:class I SAM-dependent methyltransferase [Streptomyces coryli]NGN65415.1 class I SAM-dependent methyltransferase [Streptomyces coryli]
MNMSSLKAWEGYWEDAPEGPSEVFWDADPEVTAALHLPLFADHFDIGLPLVDLGCGNGTQTRFLAGRYGQVRGVDLSAAAVERARRADPDGAYEQLDATEPAAMRRLHEELGDANVYMRGVLHQCDEPDQPRLVGGIAELLGGRGRVFAVELAETALARMQAFAAGGGEMPAKLRPVIEHGIAPGRLTDAALPRLFAEAGLEVLAEGDMPLATTEFQPDGARLELPSKWLVAGRMDVA